MTDGSELRLMGSTQGKGAQTLRGHRRRALILSVASELFATFGYDSVSINDIGAAAGISGPGLYRYFTSKEALLASIYDHLYSRHRNGFGRVISGGGSAEDMVRGLVDLQIELATTEAEKIRIISGEERHLPSELAESLRVERRETLQVWTDLVRQLRPELTPEQVDVSIHGVLALVNSISLRRAEEPLSAKAIDHLRGMALDLLLPRREGR